jgi:hypothetical protein
MGGCERLARAFGDPDARYGQRPHGRTRGARREGAAKSEVGGGARVRLAKPEREVVRRPRAEALSAVREATRRSRLRPSHPGLEFSGVGAGQVLSRPIAHPKATTEANVRRPASIKTRRTTRFTAELEQGAGFAGAALSS